jgi:hypothetical protein
MEIIFLNLDMSSSSDDKELFKDNEPHDQITL